MPEGVGSIYPAESNKYLKEISSPSLIEGGNSGRWKESHAQAVVDDLFERVVGEG